MVIYSFSHLGFSMSYVHNYSGQYRDDVGDRTISKCGWVAWSGDFYYFYFSLAYETSL